MSNENNHQQAQMLRGTAWLTASNFISRLLGAIYIIPWYIWMGSYAATANGLFTMGYNIYAWFLLISTAGIPVAISKIVADNHARRDYKTSWRLFKGTMLFMTFLGFVFAAGMYFAAPLFAKGATPEEMNNFWNKVNAKKDEKKDEKKNEKKEETTQSSSTQNQTTQSN